MKSKQIPPNTASRDALSLKEAAMEESLFPLWDIYDKLVLFEPKPAFDPIHWEYSKVRPILERSGREISTEEAERRVLLFKNPAFQKPYTTHTLAAGFQLLKQGETEGSHRHTQSAIRLVVEGTGGYTTTDGERIWMHPGDFITTPSWTWHDHGKPEAGDGDLVWLDGIDVPLINYWHLTFSEFTEGEKQQDLLVPDADSHYKYGSGLLPVTDNRLGSASPIYAYPYERTQEVFEKLERASDWDPYFGRKLIFSNPRDGGHVMPTIAAFMQHLPKGFKTKKYRSTDAAIYTVVEGKGQATIGNKTINWAKGDVFVVPNWTYAEFTALESSMLFSFSDRAAQERLCLWREDKPA